MDLTMTGNSEASNPLPSVAKLVDTGYNDDDDDYDATRRRSNCAPPSKVNGSLVYRGDSNELISNAFGGHQQVGKSFPSLLKEILEKCFKTII